MNIKQENLTKLEELQQQLESNAQPDAEYPGQEPGDPSIQEGKETLKQALYLFGEMGNEYLKGLHDRMGVPEAKLATATDLLGEAISKHIKPDAFKYSIEASAALYLGTIAVQQYRIYQEVRDEIVQGKRSRDKDQAAGQDQADDQEPVRDIKTGS